MQDSKQFEEEVDLRDLFNTIWNRKKFILIFTLVITLFSFIYVLVKNPIPIYQGTQLIEIGEIKTEQTVILIDNPRNLKYILEAEAEAETETETETETEISIPKGTNKLIQINVKNSDVEKIKNKINNIYNKLIENQKDKLSMYKEYIPTKKIGKIIITDKPINKPNKKLIITVSLVTAFILSIFIVFFIQFIQGLKEEEK